MRALIVISLITFFAIPLECAEVSREIFKFQTLASGEQVYVIVTDDPKRPFSVTDNPEKPFLVVTVGTKDCSDEYFAKIDELIAKSDPKRKPAGAPDRQVDPNIQASPCNRHRVLSEKVSVRAFRSDGTEIGLVDAEFANDGIVSVLHGTMIKNKTFKINVVDAALVDKVEVTYAGNRLTFKAQDNPRSTSPE